MEMLRGLSFVLLVFLSAAPSAAGLRFHMLGEHRFALTHTVKSFGGAAAAQKVLYQKAASICIAAEYEHLEVLQQQIDRGGGFLAGPGGTMEVRLFKEPTDTSISCAENATEFYIKKARRMLARREKNRR